MTVTVCETGTTAKDEHGNIFRINALVIEKPSPAENVYFFPHERYFKLACPPNTKHKAEVLPNGRLNIY